MACNLQHVNVRFTAIERRRTIFVYFHIASFTDSTKIMFEESFPCFLNL